MIRTITLLFALLINSVPALAAEEPHTLHRAARLSPAALTALRAPDVDQLLAGGADVEERDANGHTPLHAATLSEGDGHNGMKQLLAAGADPNARDPAGHTPLHLAAARFERTKDVRRLLRGGANPNARANDGSTPLHYAAGHGEFFSVRELLKAGANPNARDNAGDTPLHYLAARWRFSTEAGVAGLAMYSAIALASGGRRTGATGGILAAIVGAMSVEHQRNKQQQTIDALLAAQAVPTRKNHAGETPADLATRLGYAEVAAQLASITDPKSFHDIVRRGTAEQVAKLAARGVDPDARNRRKMTAMMVAVELDRVDVIKALLEAGANPGLESYTNIFRDTATPLNVAGFLGHLAALKLLLDAGADPDYMWWGRTALHHAARYARTDVARELLEKGADPNGATTQGDTPLHETTLAETGDYDAHAYIASLLIAAGAELNPLSKAIRFIDRDLTPLHYGAHRTGFGEPIVGENRIEPEFPGVWPSFVRERGPVTVLIKAGASLTITSRLGRTPFQIAAMQPTAAAVIAFLAAGAPPDMPGTNASLPMHAAAEHGTPEVLQALIEGGGLIASQTADGLTPLDWAIRGKQWENATVLLDAGASVDRPFATRPYGMEASTLHYAVLKAPTEIAQRVVAAPTFAPLTTEDHFWVLDVAIVRDDRKLVRVLLDAGIDVNVQRADDSATPLHRAIANGKWDLMSYLLERGADPRIKDKYNGTALEAAHFSFYRDKADAIRKLESAMEEWGQRTQ